MRAEAVFCTDAASARPEACRDKSKDRVAAILLAGARGTGRRRLAALCAPAPCRITQKINRERNVR